MKNARNSNVELLRFLMMAGICIWHVFVHGLNYKSLGAAGGPAELPVIDALLLVLLVCSKFSLSHTFLTLNYCNPLIILQSLGIFLFVVVIRENRNAVCYSLGAHSLSIYLITESIGYTTGLYKNLAAILKNII